MHKSNTHTHTHRERERISQRWGRNTRWETEKRTTTVNAQHTRRHASCPSRARDGTKSPTHKGRQIVRNWRVQMTVRIDDGGRTDGTDKKKSVGASVTKTNFGLACAESAHKRGESERNEMRNPEVTLPSINQPTFRFWQRSAKSMKKVLGNSPASNFKTATLDDQQAKHPSLGQF